MNHIVARFAFFMLGVAINSFGIVLITVGNLGTSPISSVPYVFSLAFPQLSFGMTTFIWNILFIMIQSFCCAAVSNPRSSCRSSRTSYSARPSTSARPSCGSLTRRRCGSGCCASCSDA